MLSLKSPVSELTFVGPVYVKRLEKLNIKTIDDLLHHIPHKYLDFTKTSSISSLKIGDVVNIQGDIKEAKNVYTKNGRQIQIVKIKDNTSEIQVVWFNQPFLIRTLREDMKLSVSGKVEWYNKKPSLFSPEYEIVTKENKTIHTQGLIPVYPETGGISSKWLRRKIADAFSKVHDQIEEYLPKTIQTTYSIIDYSTSLKYIHFPKTQNEYIDGKKRLAFNELLFLHLINLQRKSQWDKNHVIRRLNIEKNNVSVFIKNLPFSLTDSQANAIDEILNDLTKEIPMNRLLEGDVGSGKTVVAATAMFVTFINGFQSILLAPTQILAEQHFITLNKIFEPFKAKISLVTSETSHNSFDKPDIYVGTHALIHRKIDMKKIAFVTIDEQHRFGVEQRMHLVKKIGERKVAPHVLTMTATPIPRTIALTLYGDLSLSTLNQSPMSRKPITTWIVPPIKRENAYKWIDEEIEKNKIQAFVVCPLIEESNTETMKDVRSVKIEYENLKKIFPKRKLGILHGKQKQEEKNKILNEFKSGKIDILVSTPVIEVGIDIPNATIMVIEAGERFGLAQLHQLRGRVGRGDKKSYCLVFTESNSKKIIERLEALRVLKSGFELAEMDLKLRGPGEIFGFKQHGFPELKIASWQDVDLIKSSKSLAQDVLKNPSKYPKLFSLFNEKEVVPN